MSFQQVKVASIRVGDRHRQTKEIGDLKESIEQAGLINPLTVTEDYRLVAGLHRLEAVRELGWEEVPCSVLGVSDLEAELIEIDENLRRTNLSALEEGEFLVRRERVLTALRGPSEKLAEDPSVTQQRHATHSTAMEVQAATEMDLGPRSVRYRKQVATAIPEEVRDQLRDTPLADRLVDLISLARMYEENPQQAAEVASKLVSGQCRSVTAALKAPPAEDDAYENPGDDIAERLNPVRVEVTIEYRGANPRMRMRQDKVAPREDIMLVRPVRVTCSADVLDGEDGLRRMCKTVASAIYDQMRNEGWPSIGQPTKP